MKPSSLAPATPAQTELTHRSVVVAQGIGQGMDWIALTRRQAPRLDIEAHGLNVKLRRCRTHALALSAAASTPLTLGFYGQSPAGKNYLISALAGEDNGLVETGLDVNAGDFLAGMAVNRRLGDAVTRFSRRAVTSDPAYPVRLALLQEGELAKLLATATPPGGIMPPAPDRLTITERLETLERLRQPEPVGGISGDDVVSLWDYLARQPGRRRQPFTEPEFNQRFWTTAIELAPFLRVDDRVRLFSLLWADEPEFTAIYRSLAHALHRLQDATGVLAPLEMITGAGGQPHNDITVRPLMDERAGEPIELAPATLRMLAVELWVPLLHAARRPQLTSVDLVDFPGDEPMNESPEAEAGIVPWHYSWSMAKRAYLLARYTDRRELSLLMVCTAAARKSDVTPVGRALDYWVKQTQGATPQSRGQRKPGLIWALTPFDRRILHAQHYDEAVQRFVGFPGDAWGSMLVLDAGGLARMADYLSTELRLETRLARLGEQLHELRRELTENLLGHWSRTEGQDETLKKTHIADTLLKLLQTRAGVHGELLEQLLPKREVLRRLYLMHGTAPTLPPSPDLPAQDAVPDSDRDFGVGVFIDLLDEAPAGHHRDLPGATSSAACQQEEAQFARRVMHCWINHLRGLPDDGALIALLGLTKGPLEMLMAEFITAAHRLDLYGTLLTTLIDDGAGAPAESKADRQVARALTVLGDFVAWLGYQRIDPALRPASRVNPGHTLFARVELPAQNWGAAQRLTRLAPTPVNTTAFYIFDWLVGLKQLIVQNAGYTCAEEIDAEAQQRLQRILKTIDHSGLAEG